MIRVRHFLAAAAAVAVLAIAPGCQQVKSMAGGPPEQYEPAGAGQMTASADDSFADKAQNFGELFEEDE